MKRKKIVYFTTTLIIAGILMVLIAVGQAGKTFSISSIGQNDKIVKYTIGEIGCVPIGNAGFLFLEKDGLVVPKEGRKIDCSNSFGVTTSSCKLSFTFGESSSWLASDDYISITRCSKSNDVCLAERQYWADTRNVNLLTLKDRQINEVIDSFELSNNDYIKIRYFDQTLIGDDTPLEGLKVNSFFQRYGLKARGTFLAGKESWINQINCKYNPDVSRELLKSGTDVNLKFQGLDGLEPNEYNSYIETPVLIPEYDLQKIGTEWKLCESKALFELQRVTSISGQNYIYPVMSSALPVECCDSDAKIGYTCILNKWVQKSSEVKEICSATKPCKILNSAILNVEKRQTFVEYCDNGVCKDKVTVRECVSDQNCGTGSICNENWQCEDVTIKGCTTNIQCYKNEQCIDGNCKKNFDTTIVYILAIAVVLILIAVIIRIVITRKQPKRK